MFFQYNWPSDYENLYPINKNLYFIEEEYILSATSEIREIIGEDNAIMGSAVDTAVATTSTVNKIAKVTLNIGTKPMEIFPCLFV